MATDSKKHVFIEKLILLFHMVLDIYGPKEKEMEVTWTVSYLKQVLTWHLNTLTWPDTAGVPANFPGNVGWFLSS